MVSDHAHEPMTLEEFAAAVVSERLEDPEGAPTLVEAAEYVVSQGISFDEFELALQTAQAKYLEQALTDLDERVAGVEKRVREQGEQ